MDEPTAGLDKASETRVGELITRHCGTGGIVLAATHLPLGVEDAKELRLGAASGC
jgi:heme exporter protein A